jgi:hypothetical protein
VWASGVAFGCLLTHLTFLMSGGRSPDRLESVLVLTMAFTQMLVINVLLAGGLLSATCARSVGGNGSVVLLESPLRVVYRITGMVPIVSLLGRFCTRRDDRYVAAAVLASTVSLGVGGIGSLAPSIPLFAVCAICTNCLNVFVIVRVWAFSNAAFAGMHHPARVRALAAVFPLVVAGWIAPPAIEMIYQQAGMSGLTRRVCLAAIDSLLKVTLSLVLLLGGSRLEEEVISRELSLLSQQRSAAESSSVAVKQFTRWWVASIACCWPLRQRHSCGVVRYFLARLSVVAVSCQQCLVRLSRAAGRSIELSRQVTLRLLVASAPASTVCFQ